MIKLFTTFFIFSLFAFVHVVAQNDEQFQLDSMLVKHKTLTVVPFNVNLFIKKNKNKLDEDQENDIEKEHAAWFQSNLIEHINLNPDKQRFSVQVIEPNICNAKLKKAGIEPLKAYEVLPEDIGKATDGDAVLIGRVVIEKDFSKAYLSIFDTKTNTLCWRTQMVDRDGYRDKPREYVKNFAKRMAGHLPYKIKD
jgi:hypothetical protein